MEATLPPAQSNPDLEDQRLKQLALATYEIRSQFENLADYDWCQAKRELRVLQFATCMAELAAASQEGHFRDDHDSFTQSVEKLKDQAHKLFDSIDVDLSDELFQALDRMERALTNVSHETAEEGQPAVRRLASWFKSSGGPQPHS